MKVESHIQKTVKYKVFIFSLIASRSTYKHPSEILMKQLPCTLLTTHLASI